MKSIPLFILLFLNVTISAQTNRARVWIKSENAKPAILQNAGNFTNNDKLNRIFKKHNVYSYVQEAPFAKNPELRKIYDIKYFDDEDSMKKDIINNANDLFSNISSHPPVIHFYNPSDYFWTLTLQDTLEWQWNLYKTKAYKAWDITHGSSDIYIAVEDSWFDPYHPDLTYKINNPNGHPYTDPYIASLNDGSDITFDTDPSKDNHGTTTASFAGAQTNGGGQMASVGFNTMLYALDDNDGTAGAAYAADVLHADVLSISWVYGISNIAWCYNNPEYSRADKTTDSLYIEEILNAGTIIVAAAGNGLEGPSCSTNNNNQPPFGSGVPFTNLFDNRVIMVSSTDSMDNHQFFLNGTEITHSYYPQVDICAPGYNVIGAACTENSNGTANTWPYYGGFCGTSFATPQVAGVCALMKSVDPFLTPAEAKAIIKSCADPINDEAKYAGMLGAGRINAYNCVVIAGTKNMNNSEMTGTNTFKAGYSANLTNVSVKNKANINVVARSIINLGPGFTVEAGSSFSGTVVPNTVNSNNW